MKKWQIFILQHSHIDVGYTERQFLIAEYQRQFIEQAIAMSLSPSQDKRSDDTKFKFTCEGFWPVELFLKDASSEQMLDFCEAVKRGYIELTAFYVHFTELLNEENIKKMLGYSAKFANSIGYNLNIAMSCDTNGFCWGMSDILYDHGIRYLCTNINPHHGGYPFDKPFVPFYWQTPLGRRLLVWNGITYHKANLMGLVPGLNYDGDVGIPGLNISGSNEFLNIKDHTISERKVFDILEGLEKIGYEYDFVLFAGSGLYTDNSPPTDAICNHIEKWNKKHGEYVHIRTVTLREFFHYIEKNLKNIPVYKGDWNDWWSDGVASTPNETKIFREAQRTRRAVEWLDPQHKSVSSNELDMIDRNLILFSEHTWGYAYSVPIPWDSRTLGLEKGKAMYAYMADELTKEALYKIFVSKGLGKFKVNRPLKYKIINPLNSRVKTVVHIVADYWENNYIDTDFILMDEKGKTYKYQISHSGRDIIINFIIDIEEQGERIIHLCPGSKKSLKKEDKYSMSQLKDFVENEFYLMKWEDGKGIYSFYDKRSKSELINSKDHGFLMPVYQMFPLPKYSTQHELRSIAGIQKIKPYDTVEVGKLLNVFIKADGDVYRELVFEYEIRGASLFNVHVKFYKELPLIDVQVRINKDNIWDPEGMYVAFPFDIEDGIWYIDKAGKEIRPGVDQLPGTCCDYYLMQEGAVLCGSNTGIAVSSPDVPMAQIGGLNLWKYTKTIEPRGTLFSWLTNNKWETNFKASCGGFYEFNYKIEVGPELKNVSKALKKCRDNNYPLFSLRY